MTTTILISAISIVFFILGWLLTSLAATPKHRQELSAAYNGGKRAQRAVDLAYLRQLRCDLETCVDDDDEADEGDGGLLMADVFLLFDVCQALRLSEGEAQHVLGASYLMVIDEPIMVDVE